MCVIKSEVLIMDFKIEHIVLWPKDAAKKTRYLTFELNKINVITGDSQKGNRQLSL